MKDSEGPVTTTGLEHLALPMEIDASMVKQLLMPVEDYFLVVMMDGTVYSWGRNAPAYVRACERYEIDLELARRNGMQEQVRELTRAYDELRAVVNEPAQVACLMGNVVTSVTTTWNKGLALTDKGEVFLMKNSEGWATAHLQDFSIKYPAAAIASGKFHFLVLLRNGRVASWERGLAMGHGESALLVPSPKIIQAFRRHKIVQIAAGSVHSLFLTSQGELYACGLNFFGQLCLPGKPNNHQAVPVKVDTALLFLENERRRADAGISPRGTPEDIEGLARNVRVKVKAIAAGLDRSSILFDDGSVYESLGHQVPSYL